MLATTAPIWLPQTSAFRAWLKLKERLSETLAIARFASGATPAIPTPSQLAAAMPASPVPCPTMSVIPLRLLIKSRVCVTLPANSLCAALIPVSIIRIVRPCPVHSRSQASAARITRRKSSPVLPGAIVFAVYSLV